MSDQDTTTIRRGGTLQIGEDEIVNARNLYLHAYDAYTEQPTIINRKAMHEAYDKLQHIQSLYNAARKALIQKRVIERQS